jgi:hypothetical protein
MKLLIMRICPTSFHLNPSDNLLGVLSLNTFCLSSSINIRVQVSHPHGATGGIVDMHAF